MIFRIISYPIVASFVVLYIISVKSLKNVAGFGGGQQFCCFFSNLTNMPCSVLA